MLAMPASRDVDRAHDEGRRELSSRQHKAETIARPSIYARAGLAAPHFTHAGPRLAAGATLAKSTAAEDGAPSVQLEFAARTAKTFREHRHARRLPRSCPPVSAGQLDVAIVGGGLAGLYAIHRLRGMGLKVRAYEAGSGVGGTWFWNRYPGARCDVESLEYSYGFSDELQQEWKWPERYGTQPEILKYINHVADRFDLRRDVQLNTRIASALFDGEAERMDAQDRRRRGDPRALLRHGGGQSLDAAGARLQGPAELQGQVVPLRPVAA